MAASFPWFNNPSEGVEALPDDGAGLPLTDESFVALEAEVAAAFNAAELPELIDDRDDEPGEVPAFMLDDPFEEAAEAADAAVVLRLDALGISGPAAVSLIAPSVDALGGVTDEVLGPLHTAEAAAALQRVWLAAVAPGRRELTALSRRLLPTSLLPPGTRVLPVGMRSMWDSINGTRP